MRYARIENEEVVEIINFNPNGYFTKEIEKQFVKCTDDTKQNDIYEDGAFKKQLSKVPTQEELNQQIENELNKPDSRQNKLLENMFKWAVKEGYEPQEGERELIYKREKLREGLK